MPPGYVCVERKHLRKHPDRRVQRAIEGVFEEFRGCASVYELLHRMWAKGMKTPGVRSGKEAEAVEWAEPTHERLLDMLHNPKYAGIYVYGRRCDHRMAAGHRSSGAITLAREDEDALEALREEEAKLAAFDRDAPAEPTPDQIRLFP